MKCDDCKYLKQEWYEEKQCDAPHNKEMIFDKECGIKKYKEKQPIIDIDKETCGYKPSFKKKIKNALCSIRIRYYKWAEPELFN